MKLTPSDKRNAVSILRLAFLLSAVTLLPLLLYGSAPSWWSSRGVLTANAAADDYAPTNQGQLKNIARAAIAEIDANLPGGAGDELHSLVSSWSTPSAATNDFAPVNLGQLKTVAKPFYDRLIAAGLVDFYPWLASLNPPDDFAVANIGQTKELFSFEVRLNPLDDPLQNRLAAGQLSGNLALEASAVWFWGNRFALDYSFQNTIPRRLTGLPAIRSVSAGDNHRVLLTVNGKVLTWGKNNYGQLGDATNVDRETPGAVPNLTNIISVKAGAAYTLALQQDGTILAWGENYYGQLGNGDNVASSQPVSVVELNSVRKIAAGPFRSVALKEDGTVWTWGYDHYANGEDISSNTPAQVADLADVVDIAVGYEHVVAVKADGTVWAWGSNYSNQIGNGAPASAFIASPVQVSNLANVVRVAANYDHSLAILADGTVWAWGYNGSGQLGDGTTARRQRPVEVSGLTDVIAVAANYQHSLAMKADGTVWTWGQGSSGTLPDLDFRLPQQVGLGLFDANRNGIDDRWEVEYFGNLDQTAEGDFDGDGISNLQEIRRGTDPRDYFNGAPPVVEIAGGNNQVGQPGTFLSKPFKVRLRNTAGLLLVNAPVRFTISGSSGALSATFNGSQEQSLLVRTDALGEAAAYHALPNTPGSSTRTLVGADGSAASASATFRGIVHFSPPPPPTPAPDPNSSPTPTPTPTATPIAPYRYAIIDLGKDVYPSRINNKGWILLEGEQNGQWGYFRWKGGVFERLTYANPDGEMSVEDMNEAGAVVGYFSRSPWWIPNAENELQAGLFWPPDNPNAVKVSAPSAVLSIDFRKPGTLREASLSAINNSNDLFGTACTALINGWGFLNIHIMNSVMWPAGSAPPVQLSQASAVNPPNSNHSEWHGSSDTITRANSDRRYIGAKVVTSGSFLEILQTQSDMVDGQSVSFHPRDINEAGIVVGSAGADMVVHSSPTSQVTISGASPLAINDHTYPAPSPPVQSSPAPSPQPTPIPAPQILTWSGDALAIFELQPDGKTWHPFGLEEMIPSMEGWQYIEPYDMNDTGSIIGRGWYTDPSIPSASGEYHAFLLVPVELMVDANRDGEMSFADPVVHEADETSEDRPYRFWVNNDSDGLGEGQEVEGEPSDNADIYLKSSRDLEDFSRLWMCFRGFTDLVKNGGATVQLEWKPPDGGTSWLGDAGNPGINVFKAAETDGGNKYLNDKATARNQVAYGNTPADPGEYGVSIGRVSRGQPLTFPASLFGTLSESQPNKFLLFEGVGEGKGQLVLTLHKNGQKIGEYPPLYLALKDVRRMYERGKITVDAPEIHDPWDNDNPASLTWVWDPWNWPPDIDPSADQKTIAYVHGWRMTYGEYLLWANTTFKRLWHLGYKGRFYSFRWPTYHGDNNGPDPVDIFKPGGRTFNPSEYRAWLSGPALANFVNGLPNANARYLIAHSMGNVAAGSALRNNMQVTRYAMCNSAMAAMAYDGALQPNDSSFETPDTDVDPGSRQTFGLADKFNPAGTEIINFSLPQDSALGAWTLNNEFFKPQGIDLPAGKFYQYRSGASAGSKLMLGEHGADDRDLRPVTSVPEAMGYVTQSRTRAAGARQDTGGSVVSFVNMGAGIDGFQFGDEHSAEWVYSMQPTYVFWKEILKKFDIDVTNR